MGYPGNSYPGKQNKNQQPQPQYNPPQYNQPQYSAPQYNQPQYQNQYNAQYQPQGYQQGYNPHFGGHDCINDFPQPTPYTQGVPLAHGLEIINGFPRIKGRKKALLIGINYKGTRAELNGCVQDVYNMRDLLQLYGFQEILILTDESWQTEWFQPTRKSILAAMDWLIKDAKPGDVLFLHFSGHGGQKRDKSGDEEDGMDETILPLDFQKNGEIIDDEIHCIVSSLPQGVNLTAVFDSCHSGTVMDLPYCYLPNGQLEPQKQFSRVKNIGKSYVSGDLFGAVGGIFNLLQNPSFSKEKREKTRQKHTTQATIICFTACKESQTAADTQINNVATGAMSWALSTSLRRNPMQTYAQLLGSVRDLLHGKYSQKPQLSTGRLLDMNQLFAL